MMPPDKEYENESQLVADALLDLGLEDNLWIWRENTGRAYGVGVVKAALKVLMAARSGNLFQGVRDAIKLLQGAQPITFGIPGRGDISGIIFKPGMAYGRPLAGEAKIKGRKRTDEQIRWAEKFKAMGGFYVHFEQVRHIREALMAEGYLSQEAP